MTHTSLNARITLVTAFFLLVSIGFGMRFLPEPAISAEYYTEGGENNFATGGLFDVKTPPKETTNSAYGDSLEYFKMAFGLESYPPYSFRPFIPQAYGYLARFTCSVYACDDKVNGAFDRVSNLVALGNLGVAFILFAVPFWLFKQGALSQPGILLLCLFNAAHMGMVQTAPYFMLDPYTYLVFTAAALAYWRQNFFWLVVAASLGVLVKEISIILCAAILMLAYKRRQYWLAVFALAPMLVFVGLRLYYQVDPLMMQYGWQVSKGEINLTYLNSHLLIGTRSIGFFAKVFFTLGGLVIAAFLLPKTYRRDPDFVLCMALLFLVVLANVLLASRVPRVVACVIPFFVFYLASSLQKIAETSPHPR